MTERLSVGLIGYKFMGKAHTFGYANLPLIYGPQYQVTRKVICGRNAEAVQTAAAQLEWEEWDTDWRRVVERPDIDLVDISTPGDSHAEIAIAAAQCGKHILCEKPLANNLVDAKRMLEAVRQAGVKHMTNFNFRRLPAVTLAKELIDEGRVGKVYQWRASVLSDWLVPEDFPLVWRLQKDRAGSGALGDIGAHIIDFAHYLVGNISAVNGMWETFRTERPLVNDPTQKGQVSVDDAALFLARFENGAIGSFEVTRFAGGNKDVYSFEVNGDKGSLRYNYHQGSVLEYFSRDDPERIGGWRSIFAASPQHTYSSDWWPNGHIIHYGETFVSQMYELVRAIHEGRNPDPDFEVGVRNQAVLEAVERSIVEGQWVSVPQI